MHQAAGDHEQVPDPVPVAETLVESKKDDAHGVEHPARRQGRTCRSSAWSRKAGLSEQAGKAFGQCALVGESQVVHRCKRLGILVTETRNAHYKLPAFDAETFPKREVTIDVLAELAALALDANWRGAVDQHEDVDFIGIAIVQCDVQPACAGKPAIPFLGIAQASHQRMPFQPFSIEEVANGWCRLQDQPDIVFRLVVKALGHKGKIVKLLAKGRDRLGVLGRLLVQIDRRAGVLLLLRPADALQHFLEHVQFFANGLGYLVKKAAGIDTAQIGLNLDLLLVKPVVDWSVLQFVGQKVSVGQIDVCHHRGARRGLGLNGLHWRGSRFQANQFSLGIEIFIQQFFNEKQRRVNRRLGTAFGAGDALPGKALRLFGEQGAFVAADDGHGIEKMVLSMP